MRRHPPPWQIVGIVIGTGKRILVVDDDPGWRHVLTRILEPACSVVGYATHGEEVAAAAGRLRPDVITLDVSLPGRSGLNLLPELRRLLPEALIVIVTASVNPVYRDEAFRRGADGFVAKHRVFEELAPVPLRSEQSRDPYGAAVPANEAAAAL
jgi:CheY-like chemotaxis protein